MNIESGDAPLVLLCPAWKKYGAAKTVKPAAAILHSKPGSRAGPTFALRSGNVPLLRPFYGEAQPRLLLGPRPLSLRLSPPAGERLRFAEDERGDDAIQTIALIERLFQFGVTARQLPAALTCEDGSLPGQDVTVQLCES